jgi:hypothetical protein
VTLVLFLSLGAAGVGALQSAPSRDAQQTQGLGGVISGVVVDGSSGAPVAGAVVQIAAVPVRPLAGQTRQLTDERGRFAFTGLAGDLEYTLTGSKFGYLPGGYGRETLPTDPLRPIKLATDAWVPNLRLPIWKPGIISGSVRDESGEPVVGIFVRALVRIRVYGRNELASGPLAVTDDRGEYRFSGLAAGRYLVQVPSVQSTVPAGTAIVPDRSRASDGALEVNDTHRLVVSRYPLPPPPMGGRQMAYPVSFHRATSVVSQAEVIDLQYGEDRANVDITLSPVPTARVAGVVAGPPESLASLTLRLLPVGMENLGLGSEAATTLVGADGSFTFVNVPAGSYVIEAPNSVGDLATVTRSFVGPSLPLPPGRPGSGSSSAEIGLVPGVHFSRSTFRGVTAPYSGRLAVTVAAADISGLTLRLRPHVAFSGRIVVERDPAKPETPLRSLPLRVDPAGAEAHLGSAQSSSLNGPAFPGFGIPDVPPGQFYLRAYGAQGWLVKSVSWRGRDMTLVPFDTAAADDLSDIIVTVTDAVPHLSGTVRDGADLKREEAVVIAFPAERGQRSNAGFFPPRMATAAIAADGTYSLRTLPAGAYFVAAIPRSHATTWRDAEFLARVERVASTVTLAWGKPSSLDLTPAVIR